MDLVLLEIGERKSEYGSISYFFSEFPEDFDAKAMLGVFQFYGRVVEVVIPNKRNKQRKRFGVTRFCDVEDADLFAIKLDNIIIGSTKLHVNLPRFVRDGKTNNMKHDRSTPSVREQQGHTSRAYNSRMRQKVAFVGNRRRS